jgi:hypothetical protein
LHNIFPKPNKDQYITSNPFYAFKDSNNNNSTNLSNNAQALSDKSKTELLKLFSNQNYVFLKDIQQLPNMISKDTGSKAPKLQTNLTTSTSNAILSGTPSVENLQQS